MITQQKDDILLVKEVLLGNNSAYKEIVEKYKNDVYNFVLKFCGNTNDAEDVTSEAFIRAYLKIRSFKMEYQFKNWIFTIALNIARDMRRKKKYKSNSLDISVVLDEADVPTQFSDNSSNPEKEIANKEEKLNITAAIESLPLKYETAIVLRYVENLSYEDIGKIMGKPLGTVKTLIFRAQKMLYKKLK
ncbi:MAG: hypothetical protein A2252_10400 [Elusimicrobia bacterium RIFOXYA2_FULL_39_19]|nr:MAG: hypothetical protein A2252_10400 [Elusimicrobia bacterium RIFOXYA2_FULL_39_19]